MGFISKSIEDISRVLQELLKYFNGTAISTSYVLPSAGILPVIPTLNLNLNLTQNLLCYHLEYLCGTAIIILMFLHDYHTPLLDYTLASQHLDTLHYLLGCYLFHGCS